MKIMHLSTDIAMVDLSEKWKDNVSTYVAM